MNIPTPYVLVDEAKMNHNIKSMADIARKNGVSLRPHSKTHKIPTISQMQIDAGANGITVAKVSEAEIMVQNGIADIFIAYPIIGLNKINRVLELNKKVKLIVGVDSLVGSVALSQVALNKGQTVEVRLEVDTGLRRTGVEYNNALSLAKKIAKLEGLNLTGIYTFRGCMYNGKPTANREEAGIEEGQLMVSLAKHLRRAGIYLKDISVGSTPTSEFAAKVKGVTEIRPGTYIFNDVATYKSGACKLEDCAAKVISMVVSTPLPDLAIIDGGSKTFATDLALGKYPYYLEGYGKVDDNPFLLLERLSEEHGMITVIRGAKELIIGQTIGIIPNHICSTINLHDKIYIRKKSGSIKEIAVLGRGKVY